MIGHVVVAIPAHNEAATIAACLTAADAAVIHTGRPSVIVVAADACTDATVQIVERMAERLVTPIHVITGRWHTAGRSRAAAVEHGLRLLPPVNPAAIWLANTDADTIVDPRWLEHQLRHAADGAHAVAGIVTLDAATTPANLMAHFTATYRVSGSTHRHIHAANLGIRADAYRTVGGWSTTTLLGEDHALVRHLRQRQLYVAHRTDTVVTTSSRTTGRMPAGFAHRLAQLNAHHTPSALAGS